MTKHYLQHYEGLWDDFNTAIKLKPDFAEAYYDRGTLLCIYESNFPPRRGCPDICKAYKLGYPRQKNMWKQCDCDK